jgi:uncharacterized RDD family membrane protein YckC
MSQSASYRFETPENVQVSYAAAGLGTRFLAWFVDQVLVWALTLALIIVLAIAGFSVQGVITDFENGRDWEDGQQAALYFVGLIMLVWGFGSFVYFCGCELLLRGQTPGKRALKIRVVKADGFQLDASSIVVRNAFRVLDQLPPMWIIPFASRRSQRAGDMVAGTIVVSDAPAELSPVRAALAQRSPADMQFRFDATMLKRVSADEFAAIERVLDRWDDLPRDQKDTLLRAYAGPLAKKMRIEPPPGDQQLRFLEDLLLAELRRRDRNLV